MITYKKQLKTELHILLCIVISLVGVGFIFIYSSSSIFAGQKFGSSSYFVKKHILGLFLGIIALIAARITPLWFIKKYTPLFFFSSLGLTALTLIPAFSHRIHGSNRWLNIAGFSFQPSELLKISLIMYIAYFLTKKEHAPTSFIHGYLPLLIILGSTSGILLLQPDFGLMVTLITTICTLLFIAHFYIRYLGYTVLSLIPIAMTLIAMKPYRIKRILTFLNPWADPQGSGFQIIQSLIAIGSGGLYGIGIGQSKQKFFYLPMQHTDFIFSIIAEETGFIGSSLLITLFILFLYFGLRIASKLTHSFSRLAVTGFCLVISLQAMINIAVATGLAPTKGIGLPFVSYGNSALMCQLMTIGLIINMVYDE